MALKKEYVARNYKVVSEFKPGMKLRSQIIDTETGKIVGREKTWKARKREYTRTGVSIHKGGRGHNRGQFESNKFGKGESQKMVGSGKVYFQGVPVLGLKRNSLISKIKLNQLIAQAKGQKTPYGKKKWKSRESREDILEMLEYLYGYEFSPEGQKLIEPTYSVGMLPSVLKANRVLSKRKNNRKDYVLDFWTVDSEDDSQGCVKIVDFYNGKKHFTFATEDTRQKHASAGLAPAEASGAGDVIWCENVFDLREKSFDFIMKLRKGSKVFSVNIGYDLNNIVLDSYKHWENYFSGSFLVKSSLSKNEEKKKTSKVHFFEAMSQIPLSVEKMGKLLTIQKMQVDNKIDIVYCRQDNNVVWKALEKVFDFDRRNGVNFGATCGSKSLKYWRSMQTHDWRQRVFAEFIPAYRGGRSEIFRYGQQKRIKVFDVNSLYPFVMRTHEFPDPEIAHKTNELTDLGIYFAEVKVKPVFLPYLGKLVDGKFLFPTGTFKGLWTGFELIRAKPQLESIRIEDGYRFGNAGFIFKDYVDRFYRKRMENKNDPLLNVYIKTLMNALYGKFGQREMLLKYDEKSGIFKNQFEGFPDHANIIWSIFTTAYARNHLFNLMEPVQDALVYTDTDSLHLTGGVEPAKDLQGLALGQLKQEGPDYKEGLYLQPKLYSLTDYGKQRKIKAKGIPQMKGKKYRETYIDSGEVEFERPVKLVEFLRNQWYIKGNPDLARVLILNNWMKVKKRLSERYTKRVIISTSGGTWPIELSP
jgi:hypothetical protein